MNDETPNISITVSDRRTAPLSLTLYPEPALRCTNDAIEGLLPGRRLREILSGPPPCGPNHKTTVGVEAADKRRAGK